MQSLKNRVQALSMRRRLSIVAICVVVPLCGAWSCGADDSKGVGDATINQSQVNKDAANIVNMPDQFANVAWKCIGKDGIYSETGDTRFFQIVPNDPNCVK